MFVSPVHHDLVRLIVESGDHSRFSLAIDEVARALGFDFHAIARHPSRLTRSAPAPIHNYPEGWAREYQSRRLGNADPVYRASHHWACGFRWRDIDKIIHLRRHDDHMLVRAREHGIAEGFTIPAHVPGTSRGSVTFAVGRDRPFPDERLVEAETIGRIAYQTLRLLDGEGRINRRQRLTDRQLECLLWAARGKTNPEIAIILGVEADTVKKHLAPVFARYQVPTRAALTVTALIDGVLELADIFPGTILSG